MGEACEKCGSDKIIENLPLQDRGQATVAVERNPDALLFKDAVYGSVSLRICCACGRAELYVANGKELWEKYTKANP